MRRTDDCVLGYGGAKCMQYGKAVPAAVVYDHGPGGALGTAYERGLTAASCVAAAKAAGPGTGDDGDPWTAPGEVVA